jgi:ApaG protein
MIFLTTLGVTISVEQYFVSSHFAALGNDFVFAYQINITNESNNTIKLLKRHWRIASSNGDVRFVDGEGVVGQQPIIGVNESYSYNSGCHLQTEIGNMSGYYTFLDLHSMIPFEVIIPQFGLVVPHKLN